LKQRVHHEVVLVAARSNIRRSGDIHLGARSSQQAQLAWLLCSLLSYASQHYNMLDNRWGMLLARQKEGGKGGSGP
jgi:hypothetical protein